MRRLLLSCAVLALGGLAWALDDNIAQWVKDLGSADQPTREAAAANLEKAGGKAREALETASKSEDPEVAWQASRLLKRLKEGPADEEQPAPKTPPPKRLPPATRGMTRRIIISREGRTDIQEDREGHLVVKVTKGGNTEEYKADSRAEFAEKYPDVAKEYGLDKEEGPAPGLRDGEMEKRIEELRRALEERKRNGGAPQNRGLLGVEIGPVDDALRDQLDLPEGGLLIKTVEQGSRAERLGLQQYDILLTVNGKPVSTAPDIRAALQVEGPATAEIVREGDRKTLREKD